MTDWGKLHGGGVDIWQTPTSLYLKLHEEFVFTLDPCCLRHTAKCQKFYTPRENGLAQSWAGERAFVNPPYSKAGDWVQKCWQETQAPDTLAALLLHANTDTKWFHSLVLEDPTGERTHNASEIRFVKGRVAFIIDGHRGEAPPKPSIIIVFSAGHVGPPIVTSWEFEREQGIPLIPRAPKQIQGSMFNE